ncbi:UDP-glucuronosyl/UDP-glucosyltransferase [Parasponia andersonii]|uniref:UDP-glucuronosyl/UDP-glucosyltransferase n=1 Tax=Parasponia andersonii TaxID=3476 RepID=A0A2P5CPU5_PARAD|nr:UDP-glucuronosyl/UDP-glucosyltransferase [Parasponia andersonii]
MKNNVELISIPAPPVGHLRLIDPNDSVSVTILAIKTTLPSAATDSYTKSIEASQTRIKLVHVPQVLDPLPPELLRSPFKYFSLYIESHHHQVKAIVADVLSTGRVAGLVVDFFCVSMIDVAHELCLPSYVFMASNAGAMALMLHLSTPQNQISSSGITFSDPDLVVPGISDPVSPRVLPLSLMDGSYESYVKVGAKFRETRGILINTFEELELCLLSTRLTGGTC